MINDLIAATSIDPRLLDIFAQAVDGFLRGDPILEVIADAVLDGLQATLGENHIQILSAG